MGADSVSCTGSDLYVTGQTAITCRSEPAGCSIEHPPLQKGVVLNRRWVLIGAAVLVVAVLAGVGYVLFDRSRTRGVRSFEGDSVTPNKYSETDDPVAAVQEEFGAGAKGASSSVRSFEGYAITPNRYSETDDLGAAVQEEFGTGAEVADWQEIKVRFPGRSREFADEIGLAASPRVVGADDGVLVQNGGMRLLQSDIRHYYVCRFEGGAPSYFEVHDQIDSMLHLGSRHGLSMPILVKLPKK